mmetsp:Transcript_15759/g.19211  ORF Transcript_15759/g.19211 Transcript_15759/m.19211 type:complete len:367 (+) Transcript_15759:126-1226(+)
MMKVITIAFCPLLFHSLIYIEALSSSKPSLPQTGASKLLELCNEVRKNRKQSDSTLRLIGIHDALSAKIFANAGAQALFLSGFGVSASKLSQPDVGLLTQTEMEETLKLVVQAVASPNTIIPIIVDGDTGYGGIMNIRRTIRSFAKAGAAAITIEDQMFPKKCTYAAGKGVKVISTEECKERIKIAIAARDESREVDGNEVLIIARTDCRAALGLQEAVNRCKIFEDLGADICYAENLQSREEYEYLKSNLNPSTLSILAQVQTQASSSKDEGGVKINVRNDLFSPDEIGKIGFDLALYGVSPLQSVVGALKKCASTLLDPSGSGLIHVENQVPLVSFSELQEVVGFSEAERFESSHINLSNCNSE